MRRLLCITGPPCSGKTTTARMLSEGYEDVVIVRTSDIIKEVATEHEWLMLDAGLMYPNENILNSELRRRIGIALERDMPVVVDGWPRRESQVFDLGQVVKSMAVDWHHVLITEPVTPNAYDDMIYGARLKRSAAVRHHSARMMLWYSQHHHEIIKSLAQFNHSWSFISTPVLETALQPWRATFAGGAVK